MTITALIHAASLAAALNHPTELSMQNAADCMARNIWFEARGSSITDKLAIANVVMNRVADGNFPNSVCRVIYQPSQFSWTGDDRSDEVEINNASESQAWQDTQLVTNLVLYGKLPDVTDGATHYHADYVTPAWSKTMTVKAEFGAHIFYSDIQPAAGP